MLDFNNVAPAMSMLDVVRAAYRPCDNGAHCILRCEYYYFCDALKRAYHEVQRACDDNPELRSFIEQAMAEIQYNRYRSKVHKNSVYGEMKKEEDNNG